MGCGNGQGNAEVKDLAERLRQLKSEKNKKQSELNEYNLAISLANANSKIGFVKSTAEVMRKRVNEQNQVEKREINRQISDVEREIQDVERETALMYTKTGLVIGATRPNKQKLNADYIKKRKELTELQKELDGVESLEKQLEEKQTEYNRLLELKKEKLLAKATAVQRINDYKQLQQRLAELENRTLEQESQIQTLQMKKLESDEQIRISGMMNQINSQVTTIDSRINTLREENEILRQKLA